MTFPIFLDNNLFFLQLLIGAKLQSTGKEMLTTSRLTVPLPSEGEGRKKGKKFRLPLTSRVALVTIRKRKTTKTKFAIVSQYTCCFLEIQPLINFSFPFVAFPKRDLFAQAYLMFSCFCGL